MDIELVLKIGTLLIAAIGSMKLAYDWIVGRHGRLRDEYRFAKEFLHDVASNPDMHPFARQKGYQAIAGDVSLTANEVAYLLDLPDSAILLKDYVLGRPYLRHFSTAAGVRIDYRKGYETRWPRVWRKSLYFGLYAVCFMTAGGPLIFWRAIAAPAAGQQFFVFALLPLIFIPLAVMALRAGVRIARAEELVKNLKLSIGDGGHRPAVQGLFGK